jgi:hypothetical protein
MKSSVGPNPSSSSPRRELPGFGSLASTWTPFSRSSAVSEASSQNVGTCVENCFVGFAFRSPGG